MIWSKLKLRHRIAAIIMAVLLVVSAVITAADGRVAFLLSWDELFVLSGFREAAVPANELRVTVLDVGNADCILVQSGEHAALIDAGESSSGQVIVTSLRIRGVERLDYVIATHADADHIGAMDEVIRELEIGSFLTPFLTPDHKPDTRTYEHMEAALADKGLQATDAAFGTACMIGDAKLTIISGRHELEYEVDNDRSVVCSITFGEHTILLMSDVSMSVEKKLLSEGLVPQADVIKVGHHGSNTSSDPLFMAAVDPDYAIITCGFANTHGHPHEKTLQTLQEVGATVYRSDLHGDIVITSDGTTLSVTSER